VAEVGAEADELSVESVLVLLDFGAAAGARSLKNDDIGNGFESVGDRTVAGGVILERMTVACWGPGVAGVGTVSCVDFVLIP